MIKRLAIALLAALSLLVLPAPSLSAQTLDPAAAEALAATLRMLADPAARGQILAEVFADLARSTGGDPRQLSAALDRAKSDPAGFAAMLRPETLDRLRALATRISDAQR
jgi:hypothetical protein